MLAGMFKYWLRVFSRAFKDTWKFVAGHRLPALLFVIVATVLALIYQYRFLGRNVMAENIDILLTTVAAVATLAIPVFIWNVIRTPHLFEKEREVNVDDSINLLRQDIADRETQHQTEIGSLTSKLYEKDEQIAVLNTGKDVKARRRYIRERLGELIEKGDRARASAWGGGLEGHREFMAWLDEVKDFLSQEPEFDKSHIARFDALQMVALLEFIKRFED
jgi:hypothetical protein